MTTSEPPPYTPPDTAAVSDSGNATAITGGVANTGIMGDVEIVHHHYPRVAPTWPVLVGQPPGLASAFQPRQSLRDRVLVEAGRTAEAITLLERVVADSARLLGNEHPHTVAAASALQAWRAET